MSGEGRRSRRNVTRVDYTEPGDDPIEPASESSPSTSSDSSFAEGDITVVASESLESLSGFSPEEGVDIDIEREAREMPASRANQLIAEVEAVFFQLGEIKEDVSQGLDKMSVAELTDCATELKDLRVTLVKANQELNLVSNDK